MPLYVDLKVESYLEELRRRLHALDLPRRPIHAGIGTGQINDEIVKFACDLHLTRVEEYAADFMIRKDGRQGRIDWLLKHRALPIRFAIEIDRANKFWSLEKLVRAQQNGYVSIWIRWRSPMRIAVPEHVHLINLARMLEPG